MSGSNYLLDTNIVLYLLNGDKLVAELLNGNLLSVSVITELELLSFPALTDSDRKSIEDFLRECRIIELDSRIRARTVAVRSANRMKLPDSIIAATAIENGCILISADAAFKRVENLNLLLYEPNIT